MKVSRKIQNIIDAERKKEAYKFIRAFPRCPTDEVARKLKICWPAASRACFSLFKDGLIYRELRCGSERNGTAIYCWRCYDKRK